MLRVSHSFHNFCFASIRNQCELFNAFWIEICALENTSKALVFFFKDLNFAFQALKSVTFTYFKHYFFLRGLKVVMFKLDSPDIFVGTPSGLVMVMAFCCSVTSRYSALIYGFFSYVCIFQMATWILDGIIVRAVRFLCRIQCKL